MKTQSSKGLSRLGLAAIGAWLFLTPASAADLNAIYRSFQQNVARGDYPAAQADAERLEREVRAQFGTSNPNYAGILDNLGSVLKDRGKYPEAENFYQRSLAIWERLRGASHPDLVLTLDGLAIVYRNQSRYADAEEIYKRALRISEASGTSRPEFAETFNGFANLYKAQAKYADAEANYQRAIATVERHRGANHPDVATFCNNLGTLYLDLGRSADAKALLSRALAIKEKAFGANHPEVALVLHNLAVAYKNEGNDSRAEELYNRALGIELQVLGKDHPRVASTLTALSTVYQKEGRYSEAEANYRRALAISQNAFGEDHPDVALILNDLATLAVLQGRYAESEDLSQRALMIRERTLGENHPAVAQTLNNLAHVSGVAGDTRKSLGYSRRATAAILAYAALDASEGGPQGLLQRRAGYFVRHVSTLAAAVRQNIEREPAAAREALEIAQWAVQSSAGAAIVQMSARFASGGGALASLVRERQDLLTARRDKDRALLSALSKSAGQTDRATTDAIRKQIADLDGRLGAATARLDKQFPEYAALSDPKPLKATEAQRLLGSDEALLFFLTGDTESYVFAVTREAFEWHAIPIRDEELSSKITALRHGLEANELNAPGKPGKPVLFDLGLAHDLYIALIGPAEELVKGKPHLLIAPSGPLTSLPFHVLVTTKPATPTPTREEIGLYREADWLIKRQAVTVLPSVASLQALRVFAHSARAPKPMVGFGDPVFDPAERARAIARQRGESRTASVGARSYSEFWQGAGVDRNRLAQSLPSLLDTADELKAVGASLGAAAADLHLDKDATEAMVKRTPLDDYRVVYFATHGLVAGDVKGLGEPSLVLTLPREATPLDDGILTASEVAQLKLNADWVVLSACNTAAGERPGAEALSGLARSFFYAGARALLVSHWSVVSEAAERLTTSTFAIMKSEPDIGRAEALRRAMIEYMNDTSKPSNAYPAFWGPFSIVGEGALQ
jgi:CHAT domain-containing protein/tetratricopeptide (TPR) repeat protein